MQKQKDHGTIIVIGLISCCFLFLRYFQQSDGTQNENRNNYHSFPRSSLTKAFQTSQVSAYGDLPKWLPDCEKIFLDLGANIGVTIKKLFEPEKYPKSPTLSIFNKTFGYHWLQESMKRFPRRLCALGFEPNPKHQKRLTELETNYSRKNWNVHFLPFAVSNGNGNVTFYTKDNSPVGYSVYDTFLEILHNSVDFSTEY